MSSHEGAPDHPGGEPMNQGKTDASRRRTKRLGAALRENLKRRKSQARGRSDADAASSESPDFPLDDAGGEKPGA